MTHLSLCGNFRFRNKHPEIHAMHLFEAVFVGVYDALSRASRVGGNAAYEV
jgi:hypothetical protein